MINLERMYKSFSFKSNLISFSDSFFCVYDNTKFPELSKLISSLEPKDMFLSLHHFDGRYT